MLILDETHKWDGQNIKIPRCHQLSPSLVSGTRLTACLLPCSRSSNRLEMDEIIISPIQFNSWPYLWRVSGIFLEQQGIIHKLLDIVQNAGLNIVLEESSSSENRNFHEIELVVDISGRAHDLLEDTEYNWLATIERRIIVMCIDEIQILRGEPQLKIRKMKALYRAWRDYQWEWNNQVIPKPICEETTIVRDTIKVPPNIRGYLNSDKGRILMVSDTRERLLKILFPAEKDYFTRLSISEVDSVGAMEKVTRELSSAFDIVTSTARTHNHRIQGYFELLLYSKEYPQEHHESVRRKIIEDLLSNPNLNTLNIKISYPEDDKIPHSISKKPKRNHKVPFTPHQNLPQIEENMIGLRTANIIDLQLKKYYELYVKLDKEAPFSKEARRANDIINILKGLSYRERDSRSYQIFVSFTFNDHDLLHIVEDFLKNNECRVITGRDPREDLVFRNVIIRRILSANAFLGIWTSEDSKISPWLLWELGVAQAFERPYRLLIENTVDSALWQPIIPEQHHTLFDKLHFKDVADVTVNQLLEDLRKLKERGNRSDM